MKKLTELPNLTWTDNEEINSILIDLNDLLGVFWAQHGRIGETSDWKRSVLEGLNFFSLDIPLLANWVKNAPDEIDPFLKSGLFLFWFETLYNRENDPTHYGSLLAEKFIFTDDQKSLLIHSLASEIIENRFLYWNLIEQSQKNNYDITAWLKLYLNTFLSLLQTNFESLNLINFKNDYLKYLNLQLSERQIHFLCKYLDDKNKQSDIKLTNEYVVSVASCSRETAKRDLAVLVKKGVLSTQEKGRSLYYEVIA